MKAESRGEAEGHQGAREGRDGREARFGHIWPAQGPGLPDGIRTGPGSPESGSPCPGGPAAGTMHASEASGDGWRSRWETRRISLRGAMAPAGRHADCCSDRRGQERPGWLTPMEHAGRFTAWQCAEIGVHLNSKILLSAPSGRKARAPQQPQAPGLPVHGRQR